MRRLVTILGTLFALAAHGQQVTETITVERILIDVRATDHGGNPVTDMKAADFVVKIDGKAAKIESVTWVPETAAAREIAAATAPESESTESEPEPPQGRLFVLFIQTDFGRAWQRIKGQMHFVPHADELIDGLEPDDRVAVFSFDSHLKFRLDFTDNKEEVKRAMHSALAIDDPPWPQAVPNPSLARRLDRDAMLKATKSEEALLIVGNALRNIPGPKTMLLLGWGLGELVNGAVQMPAVYTIARRVIEQSRTTIFVLDTTYASYHDLEVGLQKSAADTGGTYSKTAEFPQIAIEKLQRTLSGHYELEVRKPDGLRPGTHSIDLGTKRRGVEVVGRSSYMDTP